MRGDPTTVATDIYSLGVLLFRLLTDTSPYRGTLRTDLEIARAICEEDVPRPSDSLAEAETGLSPREIGARRRALQGDLDLITLEALRKEPKHRYASVERLARDIRRHLAGEPVEAAPPSRRYRTGKFIRRHRAAVLVAVAITASLAAGLVATLIQARVARLERDRAERRFNDVRGLAGALIFEVHDAIEQLPGSTAARELLIRRALEYLDRLASEAGTDVSLQRELATAYTRIGDVQGSGGLPNLGQQQAALESYRKALAIRQRLAATAPADVTVRADLARSHRVVGLLLGEMGDSRPALEHLRTAVSINEQLLAGQPGDGSWEMELARSYIAWSDGHVYPHNWGEALQLLQKSLPLLSHVAEVGPEQARARRGLALAYKRIGGIELELRNYAASLEANRKALAIDELRLAEAPGNPEARLDVSLDLSDIALILLRVGDKRAALAEFERVRAIREDLVRADPHDTRARENLAKAIDGLALARWQLGQRGPALAARVEALAHLDALAAIMRDDVWVQHARAGELAALGVGYAQVDANRLPDPCGRARPLLVRALDAYRALAAKGQLAPDVTPSLADLEAAFSRCAPSR